MPTVHKHAVAAESRAQECRLSCAVGNYTTTAAQIADSGGKFIVGIAPQATNATLRRLNRVTGAARTGIATDSPYPITTYDAIALLRLAARFTQPS